MLSLPAIYKNQFLIKNNKCNLSDNVFNILTAEYKLAVGDLWWTSAIRRFDVLEEGIRI